MGPNTPHPSSPAAVFQEVTAQTHSAHLSLSGFQQCLTKLGYQRFQYSTSKLLFHLFDKDHSNQLGRDEFVSVLEYINRWKDCFLAYDQDKSGSINFPELKTAITTFGYRFSEVFFVKMFSKYDSDKSGSISFDEFIQLFCELHLLTEEFKKKDVNKNGNAVFQYEDFLTACLSIHT